MTVSSFDVSCVVGLEMVGNITEYPVHPVQPMWGDGGLHHGTTWFLFNAYRRLITVAPPPLRVLHSEPLGSEKSNDTFRWDDVKGLVLGTRPTLIENPFVEVLRGSRCAKVILRIYLALDVGDNHTVWTFRVTRFFEE